MNTIKRILHMLPFVHFHAPWQDINDPNNTSFQWHQKRYCTVCNRGQRRWTDSNAFL